MITKKRISFAQFLCTIIINVFYSVCLFVHFVQERLAAPHTLHVALLETLRAVIVVRIADDAIALRIEIAQQQQLGLGAFRRPSLQVLHVLRVHAEDVVECVEMLHLDLLGDIVVRQAVFLHGGQGAIVRLAADMPGADGRTVD